MEPLGLNYPAATPSSAVPESQPAPRDTPGHLTGLQGVAREDMSRLSDAAPMSLPSRTTASALAYQASTTSPETEFTVSTDLAARRSAAGTSTDVPPSPPEPGTMLGGGGFDADQVMQPNSTEADFPSQANAALLQRDLHADPTDLSASSPDARSRPSLLDFQTPFQEEFRGRSTGLLASHSEPRATLASHLNILR